MYIYLYKNEEGFITGFQSHIKQPEKWDKKNLRTLDELDYKVFLYFLTGREYVKETTKMGIAVKKIGELYLKDEGDFISEHLKITKKVIENK